MELFAFWLFAALLTFVSVLSALWPYLKVEKEELKIDETQLGTRQVLIDQLEEVEKDTQRGLINREGAQSARTEIARRLLALEREGKSRKHGVTKNSAKIYIALIVILIPMSGIALYATLGVYGAKDQPFAARQAEIQQAEAKKGPSIDDLVARVEEHLTKNPDDGRGWQTLAPIYQRLGQLVKAEIAFTNAIRIGAENKTIMGRMHNGLGQILTMKAEGRVSNQALIHFQKGKKKAPEDPTGYFFEALAFSQLEQKQEAIEAWETLLARFGSDNPPWLDVAKNTLATLKQESPEQLKGPSSNDVEAAAALSDEDRKEFIKGMVSGLASRLDQNPDDFEGWQRLIRSYVVLGEKDKATEAISKARNQFSKDSEKTKSLEIIEKNLNF